MTILSIVMPAQAGIQALELDSGVRRNDETWLELA